MGFEVTRCEPGGKERPSPGQKTRVVQVVALAGLVQGQTPEA